MTKERELLREIYADLEYDSKLPLWLRDRVRDCLSTPSDDAEEPVGYQWLHSGHFRKQIPKNANAIEWYPLYLHPPKPAEPEAEYDFYGVIPLTHRKAKGIIKDRGYHVTGFVLSRPDGDKCIVDMSAVRWLSGKEFFEMMHPPVVSPTAEPEAKPVLYIKEQELLYIQVLKQEGLAQEWKSNLGFVKEAGDVGLYLHPPKPAESEAEPKTWQGLKMHEVASLWSEALDPAYFARAIEQALKEKNTRPEPARKPMTSEEMMKQYEIDKEYFGESVMRAFYNGIRFAEKHHGITDADL